MLLTWLGAAGFKLDTDEGATLLIDPYLSRSDEANPPLSLQLADLSPVDEILLTNGRFDHSFDTPALVKQTGAIVHASAAVCQRLAELGVSNHSLQHVTLKQRKSIGSLVWRALPSLVNQAESSPILWALIRNPTIVSQMRELDRLWPVGEMVTYTFQVEGFLLIHFGSAGWIETEIRHLEPDFALLPVENASLPSTAALHLASLLKPKVIIPHHWDDYYPPLTQLIDVTQLESALGDVAPGVNIYIPKIGQSFDPSTLL